MLRATIFISATLTREAARLGSLGFLPEMTSVSIQAFSVLKQVLHSCAEQVAPEWDKLNNMDGFT